MALILINGTTGVASITVNNLVEDCFMGAWRANAVKQYFPEITFCSSGYRSDVGGIKACDVVSAGFLGHGVAASDPLLNFSNVQGGVPCIFQADANCTLTGNFYIDAGFGVVAGGPSEFVQNCRSFGTFATVWNTST